MKNYSPSTVRDRSKTLRYFLDWADERAITKPAEVTVAVLERYQRFMYYASHERGGGARSARRRIAHGTARLLPLARSGC